MKVAALGRTKWLFDSIKAVENAGHSIVLIGTCPAAPEYTVQEKDFQNLASDLNCIFFSDKAINKDEIVDLIKQSGADVAISVNWLTIIKKKVFDQFKHGVINAHAGDLPRYRGNAVPNWAMLAGEEKIVLTFHRMVEELDAGPIFSQVDYPINNLTYIGDIYQFLSEAIPLGFIKVLKQLEDGFVPRSQSIDPAMSLRCFPRMPQDSEINWEKSAVEIARLVRASAEPFSGAYTFLDSKKLIVWRGFSSRLSYPYFGVPGQVVGIQKPTGEVSVLTGDGIFVLQEIESENNARQSASDFIGSTRARLGMNVADEIVRLNRKLNELENQIRSGNAGRN